MRTKKIVIVDGYNVIMAGMPGGGGIGIRVVFTATKEEADDRILDMVRDRDRDIECLVVSSDNYVAGNSKRHGAKVMGVSDFLDERKGRGNRDRVSSPGGGRGLSPITEKEINDELKKEWGLTD